jgi:hypothetical protein
VSSGFDARRSDFPALRFIATLKAARDFGLEQSAVNAVALRFDPREVDVDVIADALAAALLQRHKLGLPNAV